MSSKLLVRPCMLAVGLGIGAAAASPTAAAQPGVHVDPALVVPDFALPAPATPMDVAISVDGFSVFQEGTATANSGTGDIAIAIGDNSEAFAGIPGSCDLGAVFGSDLISNAATGGNFLVDILPTL